MATDNKKKIDAEIGQALFSDTERFEMWFATYWKPACFVAIIAAVLAAVIFGIATARSSADRKAAFELTDAAIKALGAEIPELPDVRKKAYMEKYGLTAYDGEVLTSDKAMADYFEAAAATTTHPKLAANLLISEFMRLVEGESFACPVSAAHLGELATLVGDDVINSSTAKKLIKDMFETDALPRRWLRKEALRRLTTRNS